MRFFRKSALLAFSLLVTSFAGPVPAGGQTTQQSGAAPKNKVQVETRADGLGTIVPAQSLASGTSLTVYAIERDVANAFVGNVASVWSLTGITGGVVSGDLVSSADGKSAILTAHLKGSAAIQATSGTLTVVPSGTITVVAGPAKVIHVETAANGTGVPVPAQNLLSGNSFTGYAVSRDASGNFVANVSASWALTSVSGGVVSTDLVPSADTRSAIFTGHRIGSAQILASSAGITALPSGTITVTAGPATMIRVETAANGSGTVVAAQSLPSGKSLTGFAVTRDASLNFVANVAGTWTLINVSGGVVQADLTPSADKKSAVFTGRGKGSAQIQAAAAGLSPVSSGVITVTVTAATMIRVETAADGSGVVVPAQTLTSGRPITVYSVARDSMGVFVANQAADTWTLQNPTGGIVAADLVSSADKKSAIFTAHRAGTARLRAVAGTLTDVPSGMITVTPGPAANFTPIAGTPQSATVGTTFKTALASLVSDSAGNGVRGVPVTYSSPTSGAGGSFAGSTRTVATDSNGVATAPAFTANTIAGKYADSARAAGFSASVLFQLTNAPDSPASISVRAGTPQSTPIITAFPTRMSALVVDRFANPIPGVQVSFVPPASGPSGTFPGGSNMVTTDSTGIATAPLFVANSLSGPFTLTASVPGVATPAVFLLTNLPGKPGSIVATSGNPQSTIVGTAFGLRLTVIVRDAASNAIKNALVTFQAPFTGARAIFLGRSMDTVRTDSGGFAVSSTPMADTIAGSYSVVASVEGLPSTAIFSLSNGPGALEHFAVEFADGDPTAVRYAGVPFDLHLIALDMYGNVASGFTGTADLSSNLSLMSGGGTTAMFSEGVLGQHQVALGASGTGVLTVIRSGGSETGVSDSFAVHNPVPAVTEVTPSSGMVGYSLTVVLTGNGFLRGVTAVNFGDRITTETTVESYTRIRVNLQIDPGAVLGARDVLITNRPPGGGTTTLGGTFVVEKNLYPATIDLNGQVDFPVRSRPSDYTASDYRIIGVPGGSGWSLKDLLTGNSGKDWQAYWDNGQSSGYLLPFDDGPNFRLTSGKAFWLVGRGGFSFRGTVPTTALDSGAVGIPLHDGWNLITDPLGERRSWTEVQAANGGMTEMLFAFNGAFVASADLAPYTGYYLFNGTGRQKLRVPFIVSPSLPKPSIDPAAWRVSLDLRTGSAVDRTAALGVSGDAVSGPDRYDNRKPHAVGDVPSIEFSHPEWDARYPTFATDIRGPFVDREIWRLRVVSTRRQPLEVAWRRSGALPMRIFLVDESLARAVDLRMDSVYAFTPVMDVSRFTVVAGSEEGVKEVLSDLAPKTYALESNFPNPFNPSTTIPVSVPVLSHVRLLIYSILGEEVRVVHEGALEAGRHWFTWDGRDRGGIPVAAGVYLCRMMADGGAVFTRKMLLVK